MFLSMNFVILESISGLDLDKPNRKCYNSVMDNIITPNKFALLIENIVKDKRISYMDAILSYCDSRKTG